MITPLPGATTLKPSSATLPFFGVEPAILNDKGQELQGEAEGCAGAQTSLIPLLFKEELKPVGVPSLLEQEGLKRKRPVANLTSRGGQGLLQFTEE
jgi:hypothetical protein